MDEFLVPLSSDENTIEVYNVWGLYLFSFTSDNVVVIQKFRLHSDLCFINAATTVCWSRNA